jgi:type I restriction enzyme S subunit
MNPDWLLKHFDQISEAPDAVPRLRRFILDLAVRGKLVDQDLNDEPAVDLLQRIGQEKGRLVKEGIRKEKQLPPMPEEELPFQIPSIWQWSRLAEVGFVNPRNSADDGLQASFVPMPLISAGSYPGCPRFLLGFFLSYRDTVKVLHHIRSSK